MQRATIVLCPNEIVLLNLFLAKITQFDPDVIVGHNFFGYDLDVLLHRFKAHVPLIIRPRNLTANRRGLGLAASAFTIYPKERLPRMQSLAASSWTPT